MTAILRALRAGLKNTFKVVLIGFFVLLSQVAIAGVFYSIPGAGLLLLVNVISFIGVSLYVSRKNYASRTDKSIYYKFFVLRTVLIVVCLACLFHINQSGTTVLSLFLGAAPGQFFIFGAVGAIIGMVALFRRSVRFGLIMTLSSASILLASTIVMSTQANYANANGISLTNQELWSSEDPVPRSPDRVVEFPTSESQKLSALLWEPAAETIATRPTIVMLHGGGFASGSPADMAPTASLLADRGYSVFSIEYRLAPPERWKDATDDVVHFMQWLEVNRLSQGIESTKVVLLGNSAGGSLALNVAYGLKSGTIDTGEFPPTPPVGVAGVYPAADLTKLYESTRFQNPQPVLELYVGGSPSAVAAHWEYANPASKIVPGLPPTLIVTGQNDHLVYSEHVSSFTDDVESKGNDIQLITVPYGDHSFDARFNSPGSAIKRGVLLRWLDDLSR